MVLFIYGQGKDSDNTKNMRSIIKDVEYLGNNEKI